MPNDNRTAAYSDTEILDLIEDFLVNHFGVDDRQAMPQGPAFEMLEQIDHLVELRRHNPRQCPPESSDRTLQPTEDHAGS